MLDPDTLKDYDTVLSVASDRRGTPFWVAADDTRDASVVLRELRKPGSGHTDGEVSLGVDRKRIATLGGTSIDLRGATSLEEVTRRVAQFFAPPGERNEFAAYGDKALDDEINRTEVGSRTEWPHHREHSLKAADRMRAEKSLRGRERAAHALAHAHSPDNDAPDETPAPGM